MQENEVRNEGGRAIAFSLEEGCVLSVERAPGADGCSVTLQATTAVAVLKGISLLIVKLAEVVGCGVDEVLCKLAVVLLAPEDGGDYGSEEG